MAKRFVRIDLSDEARDFRPVAVEPGVPLLDRSNSNSKILFRWLGGLIAEPIWEGDSVNFLVRDDHGGRLEEVVVQTASAEDVKSLLKDDVAALRDRIEKAHPETPSERALKKAILREFTALLDDPHRHDLDDYIFRYRDVNNRWRLVWCWGFQRVNMEPAPAVICTDPECNLLFVRRPGQSPKCPSCEKAWAARPKKRRPWKSIALLLLLLLLAGLGGFYYWTHPSRLIASPNHWTVPVGGRIEFQVFKAGLFTKEDVSRQAVPIVLDPHVARLDAQGISALAISPGTTLVRFHLGDLKCDATLSVGDAKNPDKLTIEPRNVELGVGTTARLKVIGQYDDGTKVDLTEAAEWSVQDPKTVFAAGGLLEGLAEGTTTVAARYRAPQESDSVEASAAVSVAKINFTSLRAAVEPNKVSVGRSGQLVIDAISDEGKAYSVLESSLLSTNVAPGYVAVVEGQNLKGNHIGQGKLAAAFNDNLTAGTDFEVIVAAGLDRLTVYPEKLAMIVGEITDLSIASPFGEPITVASADQTVVEVTQENRLIGRGEGTVEVDVRQGGEKRSVEVTVTKVDIASIAIDPQRLMVPIDDAMRARVTGRIEGPQIVELAPDLVTVDKYPSPKYADFDLRALKLRGVRPTEPSSPQTLALRLGELSASAPVEVFVPPFRLKLTPPGPIDLPMGQMMRMQGWATYGGGRRVLVPSGRLEWRQEGKAEGIELRNDKVAALKAGGGPLPVYAGYFGRESNRVVFKSVEAGPVVLKLSADRDIRLTGETGLAQLSGADLKGDVELVPEMASFTSSDPKVLKIDEKSGVFRAIAPGKVALTASHVAAAKPATLDLGVFDPAKAKLVFSPSSLRLAVDEAALLRLLLEVDDDGKVKQAELSGPGVGVSAAQADAIRYQPPTVVGLKPAGPFELSASFAPYLSSAAIASIEVVEAEDPAALRVVPNTLSCAPGQAIALRVEEQITGADTWKEVRPDAVSWNAPAGLVWRPATAELRPLAVLPENAKGDYELRASYRGKEAAAILTAAIDGPDPNAEGARLVLDREPAGEFLAVGHSQRYNIFVEKDSALIPAAKIEWPEDFENQFVRWQAPVLSAKQAGYEQWLRATVAGRAVLFRTNTYAPGKYEASQPRADQPVAVKILSDQGSEVQFAVGSEFDDFRVEAQYADGFTRLVTKKATLRTSEAVQSSIVTPSLGRLVGVRAGRTAVSAEFDGVSSKEPLKVNVTAGLDVDEIRLAPAPVTMLRGETVALQATGFKNGKSVGIINGVGRLAWKSDNPQVAQVNGPSVSGIALGQGSVTASLGQVASQPVAVSVVNTIAGSLNVDPQLVRLRVGEGVRLGTNLSVLRGDMDVSNQVAVSPAIPGVVRYVPETQTLVGVAPGASSVALTLGDKLANIMVEVAPSAGAIDGTVIVEPSNVNLAPGQEVALRVFVVTADGARFDRTDAAVLSTSNPAKAMVLGTAVGAVAPGVVKITAALPGTQQTGVAAVTVNNESITELTIEPNRVDLAVGDIAPLRIVGRAASGAYELYPQNDLKLTITGLNASAIRLVGAHDVSGISPGEANVVANWQNRLNQQALVSVVDSPFTDLRIDPPAAIIRPGQTMVYQVTAMRAGQRRVLGPENGVQLVVGQQDVAQPAGGLAVRGCAPGRTTVTAQMGPQRAEASLEVAQGIGPGTAEIVTGGSNYIDTYGPGHGYIGVHDGHWHGDGYTEIPGVTDVLAPSAEVTGLRFIPEVLRMGLNSPPVGVRVVEVCADGSVARDVTADANLEVTSPPDTVAVEKTADGPLFRPIANGQVRVGAKLGALTADPLLVAVGDQLVGAARLEVAPDPLVIWSGETGAMGIVKLNPGAGQEPFAVDYRITPAPGQGIVGPAGDKAIRGLAPGTTMVTVSVVDPTGVYDGLSTTTRVEVVAADQISIQPAEVALQVGELAPTFVVTAQSPDGTSYQVPASLQSMDEAVLAPDAQFAGRYVAKAFGGTQLRAEYRGREAFSKVTVSGARFLSVDTTMNGGAEDFDVAIHVTASVAEGPLEYRSYAAGAAPEETWVPAQTQDAAQESTLRSPRLAYGPRGATYQLIIEARDTATGKVQQYPLTFRLKQDIERTDIR